MGLVIHTHRRRAVLLAIFLAVGMHQSTFAQVLCIGEDGHVEVELLTDDCCGDPAIPGSDDRTAHVDCEDADCVDRCGACVDVPIGTNGRVASQSGFIDRTGAPAVCLMVALPAVRDASATAFVGKRGTVFKTPSPPSFSVPLIL